MSLLLSQLHFSIIYVFLKQNLNTLKCIIIYVFLKQNLYLVN